MHMSLRRLVESEKFISYSVEWSSPPQSDGYLTYYVPLEIDGITEAGLVLTGGAYARYPERHVTFELAILGHDDQRRTRLIRMDWRSLTGGHTNRRGKCPGLWDGKRLPPTHMHGFEQNWIEAEQRMKKGKLPCAYPVSPEPQSFEELRIFVGSSFRINNINVVPPPDWKYDLFNDDF